MKRRKKYILGITCAGLLLFLVYALFFYGPVYRTEVTVSVVRIPTPAGLIIGTDTADQDEVRYFMKMPEEDREYIDQERFEGLRRRGARVTGEPAAD